MESYEATAIAHPNIALIKYWGNRDEALRIPSNGSISLTLGGLTTQTRVRFVPGLASDRLTINGVVESAARVSPHLDLIRQRTGQELYAEVASESDFPLNAGLASSAAAFAGLSLAGATAAGLDLGARELSVLARRGSGSAARSVFGGYVELLTGETDEDCYAQPLAAPDHWELVDLVALVSEAPKPVHSTVGHARAASSPLQPARVSDATRRLEECRKAIASRDFMRLARVVEQDSDMMHSVTMTSEPPIHYWLPQTIEIMALVRRLREEGLSVCYTVDAGPNVHCLCRPKAESDVRARLRQVVPELEFISAVPGGRPHLV